MITSNKSLNKIFSNNHNLSIMQDIFNTMADATRPTRPYNALKEEDKEPVNLLKEHEQSESMKKILFQYHEDCLNPDLPFITLTPECERIYIRAAVEGAVIGMNMATGIFTAPTVLRNEQGTITDTENFEAVN